MGRIYIWYMSDGTIKIKIHEHDKSISLTDDFMIYVSVTHTNDFPGVNFTTFYNRK